MDAVVYQDTAETITQLLELLPYAAAVDAVIAIAIVVVVCYRKAAR